MENNFEEWRLKRVFEWNFSDDFVVTNFGDNYVIVTFAKGCAIAQIYRTSANCYEVITACPAIAERRTCKKFAAASKYVLEFLRMCESEKV